jgi:radical SAM protein with 4Fe4S-binding SPASM domain
MGEPFLNKEIYSMISYSKKKYPAYIKIDTNGMILEPKKLIESGLDEIWFQIGGISQETHTTYRANGDIRKVMENLKNLLEERKRHPSCKLKIKTGMIIMKHNEPEILEFLNLKESLGVDEAMLIKPTVKDVEQGLRFLPLDYSFWVYERESFKEGRLVRKDAYPQRCPISWNSVFVAWNGDVYPCIKDNNNEYRLGNMLQDDFGVIWNGKNAKAFRRKKVSKLNLKMCAICPGYGAMPWFNYLYLKQQK